jgi:hypothetical protein
MTGTAGQLRLHLRAPKNARLTEAEMEGFMSVLESRIGRNEVESASGTLGRVSGERADTYAEHILIVYYSRSGNTRAIANLIHQEVGGTIHEIQPEVPYPSSYNAAVDQAKKEIPAGYRPALRSTLAQVESYDTIFVGSPNWWNTIAPPVATFLSEHDYAAHPSHLILPITER